MATHALNDDEYQWFRRMAADYKRRTLGGKPIRRERGQVFANTPLPVQLQLDSLVYDTAEPFGAGIDYKFSSAYPGSCVWDSDENTQRGNLESSGVTLTTDTTYDGHKFVLQRGMWRVDLYVVCLGFRFASGVYHHTETATTTDDGHNHKYDKYRRLGYENAMARFYMRWDSNDDDIYSSYFLAHVWPVAAIEKANALSDHTLPSIIGGPALIEVKYADTQCNIDLRLSANEGASEGLVYPLMSKIILQKLNSGNDPHYFPSWLASPESTYRIAKGSGTEPET